MNISEKNHQFSWLKATFVCTLAALFYLYEFSLQVAPSVMTNEIMHAFSVTAAGLGTLSACFYFAYTPTQLVGGVLYDRFGPRVLLTIATAVCALGAIVFASAHNIVFAAIGRSMIGFGSAFAFVGSLLLISRWFPANHFAWLAGIVQLLSSVGAIAGQIPLAESVAKYGWQVSLYSLGCVGFVLAACIYLFVRNYPSYYKKEEHFEEHEKKKVTKVLYNRQTWLVALYSFAIWAPITIFAALWGVPFLVTYYGISTSYASTLMSIVWIGIGLGSPFIGWISEHYGIRKLPLMGSAIIGLIASLVALYVPISIGMMLIAMLGLGIAASGQSLAFGLVKDLNPPSRVGTAIGFNNMAVVAGGALFQPLVGGLLNLFWNGQIVNNVPIYSLTAYKSSLFVMPICYILCILALRFVQETNCRPSYPTLSEMNHDKKYSGPSISYSVN